jgi:hypothetical protein
VSRWVRGPRGGGGVRRLTGVLTGLLAVFGGPGVLSGVRRQLSTAGFLIALIAVASCSSATSSDTEGVRVEAQQDVMLSDNPLGDVAVGDLEQGDEVTALCFVRRAQTNGGFFGSEIKVTTGDLTAYAAVTDFPADPSEPTGDLRARRGNPS